MIFRAHPGKAKEAAAFPEYKRSPEILTCPIPEIPPTRATQSN